MVLYARDYTQVLNQEEEIAQADYEVFINKRGIKNPKENPIHSHPNFECRKFVWCHNSYFPNNCLFFAEPKREDLESESEAFRALIYSANSENEIQSYIKSKFKWFIPGSLFKDYILVIMMHICFPN